MWIYDVLSSSHILLVFRNRILYFKERYSLGYIRSQRFVLHQVLALLDDSVERPQRLLLEPLVEHERFQSLVSANQYQRVYVWDWLLTEQSVKDAYWVWGHLRHYLSSHRASHSFETHCGSQFLSQFAELLQEVRVGLVENILATHFLEQLHLLLLPDDVNDRDSLLHRQSVDHPAQLWSSCCLYPCLRFVSLQLIKETNGCQGVHTMHGTLFEGYVFRQWDTLQGFSHHVLLETSSNAHSVIRFLTLTHCHSFALHPPSVEATATSHYSARTFPSWRNWKLYLRLFW